MQQIALFNKLISQVLRCPIKRGSSTDKHKLNQFQYFEHENLNMLIEIKTKKKKKK